jgi:uncharacterized membrane protein YcaP (DUF421 family)
MTWVHFLLGLGLEGKDLTLLHVSARAVVVFIFALAIIRVADRRFLAKMSAVDALLGFILASMLARAVNGSSAFFPTLGGALVLVLLHKACGALAFHSVTFGNLIKGREKLIIEKGKIDEGALRRHHITNADLKEELRQEGKIDSPTHVEKAYLERSGKISVVPAKEHAD